MHRTITTNLENLTTASYYLEGQLTALTTVRKHIHYILTTRYYGEYIAIKSQKDNTLIVPNADNIISMIQYTQNKYPIEDLYFKELDPFKQNIILHSPITISRIWNDKETDPIQLQKIYKSINKKEF